MKKHGIGVMLVLFTLLAAACIGFKTPLPAPVTVPTPVLQGAWFTVDCRKYLTLREGPSTESRAVGKAVQGSRVRVLGVMERFARIQTEKGQAGYVLSGYLAPVCPPPVLQGEWTVQPQKNYAYAAMCRDLTALVRRYPGELAIVNAGQSREGRNIPVAVAGNTAAPHHILIQASIHGREHMGTLLAMALLEGLLLQGPPKDVCFHILPMANPDGVAISQGGRGRDAIMAIKAADKRLGYLKKSEEQSYYSKWKANAAGVDLNRNFPAGFEKIDTRPGPSSEGYRGPYAGSEPETKALMAYTKQYPFAATISYHAMGSELYYDFGPNSPTNEAGLRFGKAIWAVTGYPPIPDDGASFGGYKDWAIEALQIPSLTIELGARASPLPLREFDMIYLRNQGVLEAAAAWVRDEGG